jgi:hypothetical protein
MESYLYGMAPIIVNFSSAFSIKNGFFLCFRKVAAISEKYGEVRRSTEKYGSNGDIKPFLPSFFRAAA